MTVVSEDVFISDLIDSYICFWELYLLVWIED